MWVVVAGGTQPFFRDLHECEVFTGFNWVQKTVWGVGVVKMKGRFILCGAMTYHFSVLQHHIQYYRMAGIVQFSEI